MATPVKSKSTEKLADKEIESSMQDPVSNDQVSGDRFGYTHAHTYPDLSEL